ncbi:MAG: hypothetical protein R2734_00120 [Nocardioides sp.]
MQRGDRHGVALVSRRGCFTLSLLALPLPERLRRRLRLTPTRRGSSRGTPAGHPASRRSAGGPAWTAIWWSTPSAGDGPDVADGTPPRLVAPRCRD